MTKLILVALFTVMTCAVAVHSLPADTVANGEAVPASFDVAMPAQTEPASAPEAPEAHAVVAVKN